MLRCVLFDLDGTLFDTGEGIMRCIREALQESGVAVSDSSDLRRFVGPPFVSALREFYGMSEADALRVKDIYRRRYAADGIDECAPVPSARECLEALRAAGIVTAVATSKPHRFALRVLERFDFLRLFDVVSADETETGTEKAEVIARVLERTGIPAADCIMVGDRKYDAIGAAAHGMRCICLRSPYAAAGEYERAGAWRIAETFAQVTEILLRARAEGGKGRR